ncbi:MAG: hypothetical protein ACAH27_05655 [Xanthobacteraceae bacterium]
MWKKLLYVAGGLVALSVGYGVFGFIGALVALAVFGIGAPKAVAYFDKPVVAPATEVPAA